MFVHLIDGNKESKRDTESECKEQRNEPGSVLEKTKPEKIVIDYEEIERRQGKQSAFGLYLVVLNVDMVSNQLSIYVVLSWRVVSFRFVSSFVKCRHGGRSAFSLYLVLLNVNLVGGQLSVYI